MDCNRATRLAAPYALDALGEAERREMEAHLAECEECALAAAGDGERLARLAGAVRQRRPSARVKRGLMRKIDAASPRGSGQRARAALSSVWARLRPAAVPSLLVLVVALGVWFDDALGRLSEENARLESRLALALEREAAALDDARTQRATLYEALRMSTAPGASVNVLNGAGAATTARGVIMASRATNRVLLLALDLPPLPADRVYQVWLVRDGRIYNGGWFTVDSTGYGQTVIIPVAPFWEFDTAGITIEPSGGSSDPTGASVLGGDL